MEADTVDDHDHRRHVRTLLRDSSGSGLECAARVAKRARHDSRLEHRRRSHQASVHQHRGIRTDAIRPHAGGHSDVRRTRGLQHSLRRDVQPAARCRRPAHKPNHAEAPVRQRVSCAVAVPGERALWIVLLHRRRPNLRIELLALGEPRSQATAEENHRGRFPAGARARLSTVGLQLLLALHESREGLGRRPELRRPVSWMAGRLHRLPHQRRFVPQSR